MNGEPPKKRCKDDKDGDGDGASGSVSSNRPIPQFDGPGDPEEDFPSFGDSKSSSLQQHKAESIGVPRSTSQRELDCETKRKDVLVYRAGHTEYTSLQPKRGRVSRMVAPEPDDNLTRVTEREDRMGEGGSKKGKMQRFGLDFDRNGRCAEERRWERGRKEEEWC